MIQWVHMKKNRLFVASAVVASLVLSNPALVLGYGATSPASAPSCGNSKPSKPYVNSVRSLGNNAVRVSWGTDVKGDNWTIAYGPGSGQYVWGVDRVGNSNTTYYDIGSLPGGTYYFVVRANNGCRPGEFSDEKSVTLGTKYVGTYVALPVNPPPTSVQVPVVPVKPVVQAPTAPPPSVQAPRAAAPVAPKNNLAAPKPANVGFFQGIANFFGSLFGGK